jgi:SAM-dependent methyltransferase
MSEEDAPRDARRASIPAPAAVPRPSRPPPPPPGSSSPPSARKGTLDGLQPRAAAFAEPEPTSADEFDSERTVVVDGPDPDDAPTADYDPRMAYDPRARGVFAPPAVPSEPVVRPRADTARSAPEPRASDAGRRRSRRTVKMDQLDPRGPGSSPGEPTPRLPEVAEVSSLLPTPARDVDFDAGAPGDVPDLSDGMADEITIVKALRIISVGSEPPPPISSAEVTWPPPAPGLGSGDIDPGWTPIAPPVGAALAAAAPVDLREEAGLPPISDEPQETLRQPSAPDIPIVEEELAAMTPVAPAVAAVAAQQAGPVVQVVEEPSDLMEEIEPESLPLPDEPPAPKKPPPPPPKARPEAKAVTEVPKKGKPWWEDIFSEEYLRTHDRPDDLLVQREVNFIEESLGMEKHAVVLDLACGSGDHTIEFALRGYNVVGLDYSTGQLSLAEQRSKQRARATTNPTVPAFVQGDMRELGYEEDFDGVFCWSTSFGYFDDEKNLAMLQSVHRSLKQGGMFLLDVANRDYVARNTPGLNWFEGDRCVCMDDTYLDFFTSRLRVKRTAMFEGGISRELDFSIRLYTLHELGKLLHEAGFKVLEVTGHPAHPGVFFGSESPRIIVLAERA